MMSTAADYAGLYEQHYPMVRAYVRRRSISDVDDLVSEVFTTAWRRRQEWASGGIPWLYSVARYTLANHARAGARRREVMDAMTATYTATSGDTGERFAMATALLALSESDRELLLLIAWEGLSITAASQALGCNESTLKVRLHRARARLSAELKSPSPVISIPQPPTVALGVSDV